MQSLHKQRGWVMFAAAAASALASYLSAKKSNEQSADSVAAQLQFQERMSSTAHQREVADLRAAGLNPILSGTGGHGSTTPAGASMQYQQEAGPAVEKGINTALSVQRQKAEIDLMKAQEASQISQPFVAQSQIELNRQSAEREKAAAEKLREETINVGGYGRDALKHEVTLTENRAKEALASAYNHQAQMWLNKAREKTEGHTAQAEELRVKGLSLELERLKNIGAVNETQYGAFLAFIEATTRALGFGSSFSVKR